MSRPKNPAPKVLAVALLGALLAPLAPARAGIKALNGSTSTGSLAAIGSGTRSRPARRVSRRGPRFLGTGRVAPRYVRSAYPAVGFQSFGMVSRPLVTPVFVTTSTGSFIAPTSSVAVSSFGQRSVRSTPRSVGPRNNAELARQRLQQGLAGRTSLPSRAPTDVSFSRTRAAFQDFQRRFGR